MISGSPRADSRVDSELCRIHSGPKPVDDLLYGVSVSGETIIKEEELS